MRQFSIFECRQNPPSFLSHLSTLPALALLSGRLPPWPQDGSWQFGHGLKARLLAEKHDSWLGFKVCSGYRGGDGPASQESNGNLCAWLKAGLNECTLKKTGVLWKTRVIYGGIICE